MEFHKSSSLIGQVKAWYEWPKPIDSDWMRTFWGNISKSRTFLNIWDRFAIRKQKLQELLLKTIHNTFKWWNFSKNSKTSCSFSAFFNRCGPWFLYISSHCKESKKCKIYILDEAVDSQAERKPDWQKNRYLTEPSHYMQDQ